MRRQIRPGGRGLAPSSHVGETGQVRTAARVIQEHPRRFVVVGRAEAAVSQQSGLRPPTRDTGMRALYSPVDTRSRDGGRLIHGPAVPGVAVVREPA
jgi:hypothetical protein